MKKISKNQSLTTSESKNSLSSSTTPPDSLQTKKEDSAPSNTETKESATSSHAPQTEDSVQSKSNEKEDDQPNIKSTFSKKSMRMVASPYSPIRLMKLLKFWIQGKLAIWLLKWRNRPVKILVYPNKKLKRISQPVDEREFGSKKIKRTIRKMSIALSHQTWGQRLGISAPQIGIHKRLFIVLGKVYINPEFTPTKAPPDTIIEGCYSLNHDERYKVSRAKYGWAKWQDTLGQWHEKKIKGLEAIVYQHALDHLNGKCCIDTGKKI